MNKFIWVAAIYLGVICTAGSAAHGPLWLGVMGGWVLLVTLAYTAESMISWQDRIKINDTNLRKIIDMLQMICDEAEKSEADSSNHE